MFLYLLAQHFEVISSYSQYQRLFRLQDKTDWYLKGMFVFTQGHIVKEESHVTEASQILLAFLSNKFMFNVQKLINWLYPGIMFWLLGLGFSPP